MASFYVADVTLFDGRRVQQHRGVLVQGERIAWVGAHARTPREAARARTVDGAGATLSPGLIDCHVHLAMDGTADFAAEAQALNEPRAVVKATANLRRHLAAGVTSVRDLGGRGIAELGRCVSEGIVPGPNLVSAGLALTITGGHGHNVGFAREVDGADAVRRAVREEIRSGARAIKLIATGGVLTPGIGSTFTAFTPGELAAAVGEAHSWGCGVAAHAIGAEGILQAVVAGVDSVEHCVQATAAVVREMKARGTFRSATTVALLGIADNPKEVPAYAVEKARALVADAKAGHARSVRAGVRQVIGTDAGTPFNPHGNAPRELLSMVEWGTRPLDAMVAATANGAELLRLPEVGTVETGKLADLCLYDGNPVEDPRTVLAPRRVWKAGRSWRD
ncbi:MAG: amidohydrolase family protein [Actinomycetota bacterium]